VGAGVVGFHGDGLAVAKQGSVEIAAFLEFGGEEELLARGGADEGRGPFGMTEGFFGASLQLERLVLGDDGFLHTWVSVDGPAEIPGGAVKLAKGGGFVALAFAVFGPRERDDTQVVQVVRVFRPEAVRPLEMTFGDCQIALGKRILTFLAYLAKIWSAASHGECGENEQD